jgi:hypothetical protein
LVTTLKIGLHLFGGAECGGLFEALPQMMITGFTNFKTLGADCEVYVRRLSLQRTDNRLISNIRKVSRTSGGFVVELDSKLQVHTLVELDVKFPGQSHYYRSRGLVEWYAKSDNPKKPHKVGIRVIAMEKLDPAGAPMAAPKQRKPAFTAGVSKRVEPTIDDVAEQAAARPASPAETKVIQRSTELKIPKLEEVSELFTSLIGEKIEVSDAPRPMDTDDIAVVGAYKGEDGRMLSLIGADIALANRLGAALAMIPKEVAENDIELRIISDETCQNTQEIFNINTSVLNGLKIPHHRFVKLYNCFNDEQPSEVRALMGDPAARVDYTVGVPGYGSGRLCYLFAEWHPGMENTAESSPPSPSQVVPEAQKPIAEKQADPGIDLAQTQFATPEILKKAEAGPSFTPVPPKATEIAELFTNLVGDAVAVDVLKGNPPGGETFAAVGNFVTDDNHTVAICALDIKLANWSAAALAMIPKDVAKMDIDNVRLSDESRDNVQEILNISASVFNKPGMPHLRFGKLVIAMDNGLPSEYDAIIGSPTERRDFTVKIPNYGEGIMSCLLKSS